MIFDTLTILSGVLLLAVGMTIAYFFGRKDREDKKPHECDGWDGIINYDHSRRGGVGDDKK